MKRFNVTVEKPFGWYRKGKKLEMDEGKTLDQAVKDGLVKKGALVKSAKAKAEELAQAAADKLAKADEHKDNK